MAEDSRVQAVSVDVRERRLSLAVGVTDMLTGALPRGDVVVTIDGLARSDEPSETGYHIFTDLELPSTSFGVAVTSGEQYYRVDSTVFVAPEGSAPPADSPPSTVVVDESLPVLSVVLVPTPAYDYPPETTVVRGFIRRPPPEGLSRPETVAERAERGVDGAVLSIASPDGGAGVSSDRLDYVVRSTASGEFALPIPLRGPVRVDSEEFDEELDTPGNGGGPGTRPAVRRRIVVGDADPVLRVRHDEIDHPPGGEPVVTLPLAVEPGAVTRLNLLLEDGELRDASPPG